MEANKKFADKGLNIASNHREPVGEEILTVLSNSNIASSADMISDQIGYSESTVKKWLNILKREGLVVKNNVGKVGFFRLRGKK